MSVPLMAESPEFVSPVIPDRADQPVSETTERFLRAIIERIPLDRIEELHLFSPLRQGTMETGIAVIAGVVLVPALPVSAGDGEGEPLELSLTESVGEVVDVAEAGADEESIAEGDVSTAAGIDDVIDEAGSYSNETVNVDAEFDPYAAEIHTEAEAGAEADLESLIDMSSSDAESIPESGSQQSPVERHTVYTARYRFIIKGPERGRWEADLVEEADAPLITVETVVRGVQRRAGEDTEIVRYNAHQIARALRIPAP